MKQQNQKKGKASKESKEQESHPEQILSTLVIDIANIKEQFEQDDKSVNKAIESKLDIANQIADQLRSFKFYFDEQSLTLIKIFDRLSKVNKLEDLVITSLNDTEWKNHNVFEFISKQLDLKSLKLEFYNDEESEKVLSRSFKLFCKSLLKMKQLESLHISIQQIEQNYLQELIESIQNLKNLKYLYISFNQVQSSLQGLDILAAYLKQNNKELKSLHLIFEECATLPEKETKLLLESIQLNKSIKDLSFSISGTQEIYKQFPQDLCQVLPKLKDLQRFYLGLASLELKPAQFKQILESLQMVNNLEYLKIDLNSTSATPDFIANLIKNQKKLTSLNLNLGYIPIKSKFQLISQSLKELTNLTSLSLDLTSTEVGSQKKGCDLLFNFLSILPLKELCLDCRNESFHDNFLVILCKQIGQCSSLQQLNLQLGCYDIEEGISSQMQKSLYGCAKLKSLTICDGLGQSWDNSFQKNFKELVDFTMSY